MVPAAEVTELFQPFRRLGNGRARHGDGLDVAVRFPARGAGQVSG
jgi:hypothetical protein